MFSVADLPIAKRIDPMEVALRRALSMQNLQRGKASLQKEQVEAKYAESKAKTAQEKAEEDLEHARQYNKLYTPKMQADIDVQNTTAELNRQQAQHYADRIAAEIARNKAEAQKITEEARKQQYFNNAMIRRYGIPPVGSGAQINVGNIPSLGESGLQQSQQQPTAAGTSSMGEYPYSPTTQETPSAGGQPISDQTQEAPGIQSSDTQQGGGGAPSISYQQQYDNSPYKAGETYHGIIMPQPTLEDIENKNMGQDSYTPKVNLAKEEAAKQSKLYTDKLASISEQADATRDMYELSNRFKNEYDLSSFTGGIYGNVPSKGSVVSAFKKMDHEQVLDQITANALVPQVSRIKTAMGNARFSNIDMLQAENLNTLNRASEPYAVDQQAAAAKAINERMQEMKRYYSYMALQNKAKKEETDMLWGEYQNKFPLWVNGKLNTDNLGNWPLYALPKALDTLRRTGSYEPSKEDLKKIRVKFPDGTISQVPKNNILKLINHPFAKGIEIL